MAHGPWYKPHGSRPRGPARPRGQGARFPRPGTRPAAPLRPGPWARAGPNMSLELMNPQTCIRHQVSSIDHYFLIEHQKKSLNAYELIRRPLLARGQGCVFRYRSLSNNYRPCFHPCSIKHPLISKLVFKVEKTRQTAPQVSKKRKSRPRRL